MLLHVGRLTARGMCAVIAAMQPSDAIIVDESLTSGGAYWDLSKVHPTFQDMCCELISGQELAFGWEFASGVCNSGQKQQC